MSKEKFMVRQGDVLIVQRSESAQGDAEKQEAHRTVLMHGEVTGHAHSFYEATNRAQTISGKDNRHLRLVETGLLRHEEHSPIEIPAGDYDLPIQTEWDDSLEPRRVAD